ncbi:uncharacterized protein CcaverHIS019_0505310 [Cutaneotrichosporon cavernicola]|uniref:RNI-like protein n=1 Tax=Cutaneotrichosporon cavernicola TaxID=279322 RepID=A0AA48L6L7_9TREE|nr:uncharacterized protein CcaverHIS019_0505310 [Cutaneotrichosporon cavernicola]BEI92903.1 hypothetical protein CcaverHIS019_0505310 [Cutaneotrichosporon cavernicola]BEJ00679.1 hypothetical protein CcaverHIS631_0505360 [Cutaneotrichosporon cavernicola]BEJ08445.1 hypothetical protein CcaverHIS641_0505390 [Cutaneotrichosporon cavernicola]
MGDKDTPGPAADTSDASPASPPPSYAHASSPSESTNALSDGTASEPPAAEDAPDAPPAPQTQPDAADAVVPLTNTPPPKPPSPDKATPSPHPSPPNPPEPISAPPRRRPKPPSKGILKPPPAPVKPTFGNRLRDIVGSVTGEVPGPSSPHAHQAVNAAMGTFNALSGRLLGRFGRDGGEGPPTPPKRQGVPPPTTPHAEPPRPVLVAAPLPASERARQKQPLKRAAFVLPSISITYPISSIAEPWSKKVLEDRDKVETRQRQLLSTASGAEYWSSMRLIKLYESACRGREEKPRLGIVRALQAIPAHPKPRLVHLVLHDTPRESLSHPAPYTLEHPLNRYAAEALADVLAVEWSLGDLRLERGVIEAEEALKPILHALLVSGTLPSLSLAGNKKIKAGGWQLVAVFLKRARSLKFIDLSETSWDKRGIDYLVQAFNSSEAPGERGPNGSRAPTPQPGEEAPGGDPRNQYGPFLATAPLLKDVDVDALPSAVQSLRLDNCYMRSGVLDALASGIRSSELRHISLRNNRIGPLGAVSLAVMIRDYPDTSAFGTLSGAGTELPYAARQRKTLPELPPDDPNLPPVPALSSTGGVTTRVDPEGYKPPPAPKHPLVMPGGGYSAMQESASFSLNSSAVEGKLSAPEFGGASLALQRSVRALDGVERIGRLVTLDLKSNDIRNGVTYIAQVLKRNRTLRVLNVSDNKLDAAGLVALAEALKYNSTLETLDVSSNPCCGPSLVAIAALRASFTLNSSLKRLFLQDTGLTTEGAIDLAEFIPENHSLLHLDVTANPAIGTAGLLALASGLKSNNVVRCLDVSIPPNDPNLAELSQSILQSCIRNTELAATAANESAKGKPARGAKAAIWGPIKKSALVRSVKEADEARAQRERETVVNSVEGQAREFVYRLKPEQLLPAAEETVRGLESWYAAGVNVRRGPHAAWEGTQMPKDDFRPLVERSRALSERIATTLAAGEEVAAVADATHLERLLVLNDKLTTLVGNARGFMPPPRILLPSQIAFSAPAPPVITAPQSGHLTTPRRRHQHSTSLEISSPNFSIGDSDAESDAEELDAATLAPTSRGILAQSMDKMRADRRAAAKRPQPTISVVTNGDKEAKDPEDVKHAERLVEAELAQGLLSSPVDHVSRRWVEEEAEIFRRGTRLGVVDSDSEDEDGKKKAAPPALQGDTSGLSGEELRKEIMNTDVPRSPPRSVAELNADDSDDSKDDEAA